MSPHFFHPGETVVTRDIHRGRLRAAVASTVVEDTATRTVLYLQQGAEFRLPANAAGVLTKDPVEATQLMALRWVGFDFALRHVFQDQVLILRPGEAHGVFIRRIGPERRVAEWYVNLQAPMERTAIGFDTTDHALDLVLSPDLSSHRWKDEDELARLVASGHFSPAEARKFRGEGEDVLQRAKRREPPFDNLWTDWRPNAGWVVPELPPGWDLV